MNKIKNIWRNNKIFIVLILILIICFIAICGVVVTYFFGGSETVYGTRLNDADKHPISDTFKNEYIAKLKENKAISKADLKVKGRVIYISITLAPDTPLSEAQSKAAESLSSFTEDMLSYYDINITLNCEKTTNSDGYTIMGAKNSSSTSVVWNNNTKVESDD